MAQPQELPFGHVSLSHTSSKAASRPWQLSLSLSPERNFLFFGLIVLYDGPEGNDQVAAELAQRIQGTIQYHHQVLMGHQVSLTHEDLFEQCLQKINSEMNVFLRDVQIALPVHRWAMSVGMLAPDTSSEHWQVFLSRFGDISAWLLHKAQLDTYKLISIFDTPDPITGSPGAQKYFKNIVSSSISKQDQILFCTPNIFNYISLSETKKILVELSAKSAMRHMQNVLQESLQDPVASALTIKLSSFKQVQTPQSAPISQANEAAHSMNELMATQSQTERILGTGGAFSLAQVTSAAKRVMSSVAGPTATAKQTKPTGQALKPKSKAMGRLAPILEQMNRVMQPLLARLQAWRERRPKQTPMGKSDYVAIHGTVARVSQWRAFVARFITPIWHSIQWKTLIRSPRLLGVLVVLVVMVVLGHRLYQNKQTEQATIADAESTLQTIKTTLDRIDSYLIVGRETDAVLLTQQAKTDLAKIGDDLEQFAEQKLAYANKIEEQQRRLRKEIPVQGAQPIVEDLETRLNSPAKHVLSVDESFLIIGADPHTMIEYSLASKQARSQTMATDLTASDAAARTATNVYVRAGNTMASMNVARGTSTPSTTTSNRAELGAMTLYNNRLYALSPSEGQIQRSNGLPNFSVFSPWLDQADMALGQAVDLAIDGAIYVLTPTTMLQYAQNTRVNSFSIDAVEPPLTQALAFSYEAENKHFFVLEPKRLLVYKKSGAFVAQYLFPADMSAIDLVVDEPTSTAYVLTADTLLSFPIQLSQ